MASQLQVNSSKKLLNSKVPTLPIPQNSNLSWCKKRCATPPYCGDTNASDLILMLNKYELYVSWSPFWWKTRWLHRSRACSETWELNGVQKHHIDLALFYLFPYVSLSAGCGWFILRGTFLWCCGEQLYLGCVNFENFCVSVFKVLIHWPIAGGKKFYDGRSLAALSLLQEIHKCHSPEMPPVLHIKNCLMKNNPGHVAIIHHVNNVAIHKLARELLDESNGTSFVSSVTQRPVVAPVWLDDGVEIASNLEPSRTFVTYHNVLCSHDLNISDPDRLTLQNRTSPMSQFWNEGNNVQNKLPAVCLIGCYPCQMITFDCIIKRIWSSLWR